MFSNFLRVILSVFSCLLHAQPNVSDLLTSNVKLVDSQILFVQKTGPAQEISELELHFLGGDDCYSGWTSMFSTRPDSSFTVHQDLQFGFDPKFIYQALLNSNSPDTVSGIHSMLVRFILAKKNNSYDRFAKFVGSCQDQTINCCIPIVCSDHNNSCVAAHIFTPQEIIWSTLENND